MIPGRIARSAAPLLFLLALLPAPTRGQESLSAQLLAESPESLAAAARDQGDPSRGAIVFHRSASTCTQCHDPGGQSQSLGPDLARPAPGTTDLHLVESILSPSKTIRKGFETRHHCHHRWPRPHRPTRRKSARHTPPARPCSPRRRPSPSPALTSTSNPATALLSCPPVWPTCSAPASNFSTSFAT